MVDEADENAAQLKKNAHDCLMQGGGWLGIVYREQVRRVRALKEQLDNLKEKRRGNLSK